MGDAWLAFLRSWVRPPGLPREKRDLDVDYWIHEVILSIGVLEAGCGGTHLNPTTGRQKQVDF